MLRDTTMMTYQKLLHYLLRIFWMLSIDEDPFQSVQIMIPGYPQILIGVNTLNSNLPYIMDIILNTCWHWPAIATRRTGAEAEAPLIPTDTTPTTIPQ